MNVRALVGVVILGAPGCGGEDAQPPAPNGIGEIRVATVLDAIGPGADLTTIDAHFEPFGTRTSCTVSAHGSCAVYECAGGSSSSRPDAGQLALDTSDGRFTQRLLPDASGLYSFGDEAGVFIPGEEISVSFSGGEVPAFDVVGVFPEPVVLTEPAMTIGGEPLVVPRGADLTLRWTGGVEGNALSVSLDTASPAVLRCLVASPAGVLTVPASALGELAGGRLDVRTVRTVAARPSGYDVTLVLLAAGVNADGDGVSLALEP